MRTETNETWKSIVAGAIGGLLGSLVMNQFQAAVSAVSEAAARKERERTREPEPEQSLESGSDDATVKTAKAISCGLFDHQLTEDEKKWAGPAVHYGFGTALGALYGGLACYTPIETGAGTGYGAGVWMGADEVAVPLFGLSGPPNETPLSGHMEALASHLVFGLVTHAVRKIVLS
jgi:uncharacterized membrane protein YagU involved in acid resistance